jgi:hypothetical protein
VLGGVALSPGAFAALILGIIAFFVLLGVLLFYIRSKRGRETEAVETDTTRLIGKRSTETSFGQRESGTRDGSKARNGMVEVGRPTSIYWNKYI